jgi:hypothetical protein
MMRAISISIESIDNPKLIRMAQNAYVPPARNGIIIENDVDETILVADDAPSVIVVRRVLRAQAVDDNLSVNGKVKQRLRLG